MAQRGKQQGNIPPGIRMPTQWEGNGIHGDLLRQLYEKGSFREGMTSDQYKQSVMLSDVRFMYRNRRGQTPTPSAQLQNANRWLRNYLADRGATGARLEGMSEILFWLLNVLISSHEFSCRGSRSWNARQKAKRNARWNTRPRSKASSSSSKGTKGSC